MASSHPVTTAGEAVARIAYLASDVVVSVQPSLATESEFSAHLKSLVKAKTQSLVASSESSIPEIQAVRHNADPLLSVFAPIRAGRLTSVTTSSVILLASVARLYKLANYPVVLHVALHPDNTPDYSAITAIRNAGWSFLQSGSLQESQDMALTAHALAIRSGKGVVHFFNPAALAKDEPIAQEDLSVVQSVLDIDSVRRFQSAPDSSSQGVYADDGRVATVAESVEAVAPAAGATPAAANLDLAADVAASSRASEKSSQESTTSSLTATSPATTIEPSVPVVTSEEIYKYASAIWSQIESATGRKYSAFEWTGPSDAENCFFVFGSDASLFANPEFASKNSTGVLVPRLYRPWLAAKLTEALPKSVKRIAVLEQISRKTTKWGPTLLDVLTAVKSGAGGIETIVGYHLGYITPDTIDQALRGVYQNLTAAKPVQNLEVGAQEAPAAEESSEYSLEKPKVETAYTKILGQLFNDRLYVANTIETETTGVSTTISATPEFGLGSLLARKERRQRFVADAKKAAVSGKFDSATPQTSLARWSSVANDTKKADEAAEDVKTQLQADKSELARTLLEGKQFLRKESLWLVGSDAWSYDLGNSGVHHVLASGENVNVLIIDSTPYSERAAADANRRKKDIGLYAMNYGNAYVASVAVYSSYTQVLQAMDEADKFNGPSIVMAYLPYFGEHDSALTVLRETKTAVDLGYWPLYRWNPENELKNEPNFSMDSERIKKELKEFLDRDNKLTDRKSVV